MTDEWLDFIAKLFKNYRTVKMIDFKRKLSCNEAVNKYKTNLTEEESEEIKPDEECRSRRYLEFQKSYYNRTSK